MSDETFEQYMERSKKELKSKLGRWSEQNEVAMRGITGLLLDGNPGALIVRDKSGEQFHVHYMNCNTKIKLMMIANLLMAQAKSS